MAFYVDKSTVDTSNSGVILLDKKGIITDVDDSFILLTQFKKEELLGYPLNKFHHHSAQIINTNTSCDMFEHIESVLKLKNGNEISVEIYLYSQQYNNEQGFKLVIKNINNLISGQRENSIYKQMFSNSKEAIVVTDKQGDILKVNQSYCHITGYTDEESLYNNLSMLKSGKQDKYFYEDFWGKLKTDGYWEGEIWNKRKNGDIFPEWLNISSIKDGNSNITNYIAQFTDITQRKKSEEEKHFHAYHDALTNLPNRHFLFEKLTRLCEININEPTFFAVIFCDLDRFKSINDSLGYDVGNELLKSIADRFEAKLQNGELIARSGGDEFVVVIEGELALNNIDKVCLQILALFNEPFNTKYGKFKASISIGVSQFPEDSKDVWELISFSDVAMLKVKESGGNHYSLFDPKEKLFIKRRLELEKEIIKAIEKNQFEVVYQPQIDAESNKVYGVECLLRWNHPEQGNIPPNLFIPIAEATGVIKQLGLFVLKTACHQSKKWRINKMFKGVMAINISIKQFERNDLLAQVKKVLTDEMLDGDAIELEVTESLFSEENTHLNPTLSALRELGVKIAIDDFGTGYSSLKRLQSLPIDNVKIDKCFVDNIVESREDASIIEALILMSKTFEFDLIAEGVETEKQANKLKALGCKNHQGFLYSKPLKGKDFELWINIQKG